MTANNQTSATQAKKANSRIKYFISAIVFLGIAGLIYFNYSAIYIRSYYLFKTEHFSIGEKVYATKNFFDDKRYTGIAIYRRIRPITKKEYKDSLLYDDDEAEYYLKQDTSKGTFLITASLFRKANIEKVKTSYLGIYKDHVFLDCLDDSSNKLLSNSLYQIEPNPALYDTLFTNPNKHINYTWADNKFYILSGNSSSKEWLSKK